MVSSCLIWQEHKVHHLHFHRYLEFLCCAELKGQLKLKEIQTSLGTTTTTSTTLTSSTASASGPSPAPTPVAGAPIVGAAPAGAQAAAAAAQTAAAITQLTDEQKRIVFEFKQKMAQLPPDQQPAFIAQHKGALLKQLNFQPTQLQLLRNNHIQLQLSRPQVRTLPTVVQGQGQVQQQQQNVIITLFFLGTIHVLRQKKWIVECVVRMHFLLISKVKGASI